ncbi:MAG: lytic transglycosylase domain-containing protein [Candidatus Latescibacterota bacterium]|nr:lytic transglycosylase domain-containing protein [Candidatus Latescibacterota bacterium]
MSRRKISSSRVTTEVVLTVLAMFSATPMWAGNSAADIARRSFGGELASTILGRSSHYRAPSLAARQDRPAEDYAAKAATATSLLNIDPVRLERTERYATLIDYHGMLNRIDAGLIKAIVYTESGGDALAESSQGAKGLMQLMPETAEEFGAADPFNPEHSIASGAQYLRTLMDHYGSTEVALWAYNAGPGSVTRGHLPRETEAYVPRVLRMRNYFDARERVGESE